MPLLQLTAIAAGLPASGAAPAMAACGCPATASSSGSSLNFVAVDYLYYWNHRLLHTRRLWPVHQVHHTVHEMDVLGTSRNTAWSSLLILYVWVNGAMLFLLAEPAGYALGAAVTASLDLWRHSELSPRAGGALDRLLGRFLVLPRHHAWHHASDEVDANFGANWTLWDRLHGTWLDRDGAPARLGVATSLPLWRQLWWPLP